MNELIEDLELQDVQAIHGRAEELGSNIAYREQYDCCVSRAVSQLPVLSEYCIPFVKVNGRFVAYKSVNTDEEIESAIYAIELLGGKVDKVVDVDLLKGEMPRRFVILDKIQNTPDRYPRRSGMPQKKPLLAHR